MNIIEDSDTRGHWRFGVIELTSSLNENRNKWNNESRIVRTDGEKKSLV